MDHYFAVQAYSPRRGHFITLFAPYNSEADACRKATELRKDNPQILYRVIEREPQLSIQ
jgi:hypothetical protein